MTKKIIIFGNCQASQVERILSASLPASEFEISFFANNTRTGERRSNSEVIAAIRDCDVLIYQPLSRAHAELSDDTIRKMTKPNCVSISFPYIFNSGICSLCHAPQSGTRNYGLIFGEEIILGQMKAGKTKEEVLHDYRSGTIDFHVVSRFSESLAKMKDREVSTDIKLTGFIEQNYKQKKLFLTHNHPSNIVLREIIRHVADIATLPVMNTVFINVSNFPDLPQTDCPISPYDVQAHGYTFHEDEDWMVKGARLIELIAESYLAERGRADEN